MPRRITDTTKHPGYSTINNTFRPFRLIIAGQLSAGEKFQLSLLENLGISRSKSYEVRTAWRYLQFLDDEDRVTPVCEHLARAPDEQRPKLLEAVLRKAYAEIFHTLSDPAHATQQALEHAFQMGNYEPMTMQSKMIRLFRGLCREAGLRTDEIKEIEEPEERIMESPLPILPQKTVALLEREGNPPMVEPSSPLLVHDSGSSKDVGAKKKELGKVLGRLLQIPENSIWTDADFVWWDQAVLPIAEQIIQVIKNQRKGDN